MFQARMDGSWMYFMSWMSMGRKFKMKDLLIIYARLLQLKVLPDQGYTMILLSGIDRPGLLYELSEILAHHGVRIVNADLWTHKHHASAMVNVVDESTGSKISDSQKLSGIKKDLGHIIKPSVKFRSPEDWNVEDRSSRTRVTASNCSYRDYTRIDIRSDNRVNLLLDTISTLMVMQHVVFHGSVSVGKIKTFQEYYIRHVDGWSISRTEERDELEESLEQTVNSPDSEGVEVEFCFNGQLIQLSKIMTVLRDIGCWIKRAQISTVDAEV